MTGLLANKSVPCVRMIKDYVSDGEGGHVLSWKEGLQFDAAIALNSSTEAQIAEQQDMNPVYHVITDKKIGLAYQDVFMRLADSVYFRVTSDSVDMNTPSSSTLELAQVSAMRLKGMPQ